MRVPSQQFGERVAAEVHASGSSKVHDYLLQPGTDRQSNGVSGVPPVRVPSSESRSTYDHLRVSTAVRATVDSEKLHR